MSKNLNQWKVNSNESGKGKIKLDYTQSKLK